MTHILSQLDLFNFFSVRVGISVLRVLIDLSTASGDLSAPCGDLSTACGDLSTACGKLVLRKLAYRMFLIMLTLSATHRMPRTVL